MTIKLNEADRIGAWTIAMRIWDKDDKDPQALMKAYGVALWRIALAKRQLADNQVALTMPDGAYAVTLDADHNIMLDRRW